MRKDIRHIRVALAVALLLCVWPAHPSRGGEGRMAKAGDGRLHMEVDGQGTPTVILEAGFGGTAEGWAKVQPEVAKFARVVSYDRAGLGKSEPGRSPRSAGRIARELHDALKAAHVPPPYVLVGHSAGGAYARVFAHMYPKEVAGLILIVPPQEEFLDWLKEHHPEQLRMPEGRLAELPEGMRAEWDAREAAVEEMRGAWPLPRVPVVLLTSKREDEAMAKELSQEALQILSGARGRWLGRVPGARQVVAGQSGHNIPRDEPELVVETIRQVWTEAKKGRVGD